jgi:hypothetical protein
MRSPWEQCVISRDEPMHDTSLRQGADRFPGVLLRSKAVQFSIGRANVQPSSGQARRRRKTIC